MEFAFLYVNVAVDCIKKVVISRSNLLQPEGIEPTVLKLVPSYLFSLQLEGHGMAHSRDIKCSSCCPESNQKLYVCPGILIPKEELKIFSLRFYQKVKQYKIGQVGPYNLIGLSEMIQQKSNCLQTMVCLTPFAKTYSISY